MEENSLQGYHLWVVWFQEVIAKQLKKLLFLYTANTSFFFNKYMLLNNIHTDGSINFVQKSDQAAD